MLATPIFVMYVCTDSTPNEQKNVLNVKIDQSSPLRSVKMHLYSQFF